MAEVVRGLRAGRLSAWLASRVEARSLFLILLFATGVWIFVALAGEVQEGETASLDQAMIMAMRSAGDVARPIGPPWVQEFGRDMTALGGLGVLTLLTLFVAGFLWLQSRKRSSLVLLVSIGGGRVFASILKFVFDRPRPELVPHGVFVTSSSFPSAHSMMAAITYLTLAAMLARTQARRSARIYLITVAFLVTALVGVSRVYLGVHWPTDVIAGWIVGALWAMTTLFAADRLDVTVRYGLRIGRRGDELKIGI